MAEDWLTDVKKYVPNPDEAAVAGIVRHCGIALRSRDASLVSFSDPAETSRVRENFLKKKLGLTEPDSVLDSAIADVGERMKDDRTKNRVTVYYLLAEHFGLLSLFHGKGGAAELPVETGDETSGDGAIAAGAGLAGAGALGLAGLGGTAEAAATPAPVPPPPVAPFSTAATTGTERPEAFADLPQGGGGGRWWLWALLALLALALLFFLLRSCQPQTAATGTLNATEANVSDVDTTGNDMLANVGGTTDIDTNATAAVPPAAPAGAAVTAETRNGAPALNVYFDTAKSDVAPEFATVSKTLTDYLKANPGKVVTVSGFNDPTGNAAFNAELSKHRAQGVAAALKAAGVPDSAVELTKPADTTINTSDNSAARRVEVTVKP